MPTEHMHLLNSLPRGNLVDGLPRAASLRNDCWVGDPVNSNYGEILGPASGGSGQTYLLFSVPEIKISLNPVIHLG